MTAPLTPKEIMDVRRLARLGKTAPPARERFAIPKHDASGPRKGIFKGMMIGSALWVVIGIILYFTFFRGM